MRPKQILAGECRTSAGHRIGALIIRQAIQEIKTKEQHEFTS